MTCCRLPGPSRATAGPGVGKAFSQGPIAISFWLKHPANFRPRKLPSPALPRSPPPHDGPVFRHSSAGGRDWSLTSIALAEGRQIIPYNRNHTSHLWSCTQCTSAVAYTFSDFFFCYKLEHTSTVVTLTLTEIQDAEGVQWRDAEGIEGVRNGEDMRIIICGVWSWILDLQSWAQAGSSTIKHVISSIHSWSSTNTEERNCKFAIQVVSSRKVIGGGSSGLPYRRRVVSLSTWLDLKAYRRRRRFRGLVWRALSRYYVKLP